MSAAAPWRLSWKADPVARSIADRHYNRQTVGAVQFVPPGRSLVLVAEDSTADAGAFWITSWPLAEYVRHDWAGAWVCSAFRNELAHGARGSVHAGYLSSDLVVAAVAATLWRWPVPPRVPSDPADPASFPVGMVTFIDETQTRRKRDPGRCFLRAGFEVIGRTKDRDLVALGLRRERMPAPAEPAPRAGALFAA